MKYTNNNNIAPSVALWLANDTYVYNDAPKTISVTEVLKPIQALILERRYPELKDTPKELAGQLASSIGTAIHDSIEKAWNTSPKTLLKNLNYPLPFIKSVTINPDAPTQGIDIYTERRASKKIAGYHVSGEFDFCIEGVVEDFKYTGTYTYSNNTNTSQYVQQLSMYRWIHQDVITADYGNIHHIFKDWSANRTYTEGYPQTNPITTQYPLLPLTEVESFLFTKLTLLDYHLLNEEEPLPRCTPEELWEAPTMYKYFKNPQGKRATKNFANPTDAYNRLHADGNIGIVKEVKGTVRRCAYCAASTKCSQAQEYVKLGILKL